MAVKAKPVTVAIMRMAHAEGLPTPAYQTDEAAGLDLAAAVMDDAPLILKSGARALVPTGLVIQLPPGVEGQIRPRSGLALKHGVTVLNSPGTIDSDYRGELQVLLINHGAEGFTITRGMRIAQMVVAPVAHARIIEIEVVTATGRGGGGFGSTGMKSLTKSKAVRTRGKKR